MLVKKYVGIINLKSITGFPVAYAPLLSAWIWQSPFFPTPCCRYWWNRRLHPLRTRIRQCFAESTSKLITSTPTLSSNTQHVINRKFCGAASLTVFIFIVLAAPMNSGAFNRGRRPATVNLVAPTLQYINRLDDLNKILGGKIDFAGFILYYSCRIASCVGQIVILFRGWPLGETRYLSSNPPKYGRLLPFKDIRELPPRRRACAWK